jgi:hypothetical protein
MALNCFKCRPTPSNPDCIASYRGFVQISEARMLSRSGFPMATSYNSVSFSAVDIHYPSCYTEIDEQDDEDV